MARTMLEPARRVPVLGYFDVVVAGGGPAGIGAAVAAARRGVKVLLLEQTACLGGMGTAGLVPSLAPYSHFERPLHTGIALEMVERLRAADGVGADKKTFCWVTIDAEKLKRVYDQMAAEAGVRVLFMTCVAGVVRRGDRIRAVLIENKQGRQAVEARTFIDATGDADLAARAGVPFEKGDEHGRMQGVSLEFTVAGVNCRRYWKFCRERFGGQNAPMRAWVRQYEAKGLLPRLKGAEYGVIAQKQLAPDTLGYNFGHVFGIDGTDPVQVSYALAKGREIAHNYVAFGRRHIPGMEHAHIVATGALLGVRETRRIAGRCRLVIDDFLHARHFPDEITMSDYPVDVHAPTRSKLGEKILDKWYNTRLPPGDSFGIPFGCMVPRRIRNLLVPGRAVSADRLMQATIRVMPACLAMGQAAGTAAVLAQRAGQDVCEVEATKLRQALRRDGVDLPDPATFSTSRRVRRKGAADQAD